MGNTKYDGSALYGGFKEEYRYDLRRYTSDYNLKSDQDLIFIMLNPSTATWNENDPTVRRCEGFMEAWGFKSLIVLNIFALRSRDPVALISSHDPIGPLNNDTLKCMVNPGFSKKKPLIICAWGEHGKLNGRGQEVLHLLLKEGAIPHYLEMNKSGEPKHPLYTRKDLKPILWNTTMEELKWLDQMK